MNNYIVLVKEETSTQLNIEANSIQEAELIARQEYENGNATFGDLSISYSVHLQQEMEKSLI